MSKKRVDRPLLLLTTAGSTAQARGLARHLVGQRLAACTNLVGGLESWYWWEGQVEKAREVLLLIKTTASRRKDVDRAIRKHHPYTLPELIALPLTWAQPKYLAWIRKSLEGPSAKV